MYEFNNSLKQSRLKELLYYNPDTGIFVWKVKKYRANKGDIAGSIRPDGYREISIDTQRLFLHRVAFLYMTGSMPLNQVDHINHNPSDNRWVNLRQSTGLQNNRNCSKSKNNASGNTGVYFNKTIKRWIANICIDYKTIYLGCSKDKQEAIQFRKAAEIKYNFHDNHGV